VYGAILMAIAIALGAFGAHGLKNILEDRMLDVYNTGVQYQVYHSIGLIILGIMSMFIKNIYLKIARITMISGIFLFSGSLYALSLSGIKYLGIITPFGGVMFIISWVMLALAIIKTTKN
jgi:uncharacterized membrane protein YgdD (TMEM256/DUF423 family)